MIKSYLCQFCGIERDDGWHDCFHALKALVRELKPERDEALRMERQAHARVAGLEAALAKYREVGDCVVNLAAALSPAPAPSETPIASRGECPKCGGYFPAAGGTVGPHECLGAETVAKCRHERTADGFCHICGTYGNGETAAGG